MLLPHCVIRKIEFIHSPYIYKILIMCQTVFKGLEIKAMVKVPDEWRDYLTMAI